jgi:acetyl-CoA carboxylase biotin carboxyl carrier protein
VSAAEPEHGQRRDVDQAHALLAIRQELAILAKTLPGSLRRLRVVADAHTVEVEWAPEQSATGPAAELRSAVAADRPPAAVPADAGRHTVRAPLVGAFYRAPQPGAAPFVAPGDRVEEGDTIGIVEAMKLMNQVAADAAGRVVEILVGDGESVEYDQPLVVLEDVEQGRTA